MKHAKIFLTFLIILSCFTAGFSMTALAGNDNVPFSFTMKANMKRAIPEIGIGKPQEQTIRGKWI